MGNYERWLGLPGLPEFVCHPNAVSFSYRLTTGDPDQASEIEGFSKACQKGMRFIDIGAHFGLFSLIASEAGAEKVIAVDPSGTACQMTRLQVHLNGFSDQVEVVQSAVSDQDGKLRMLGVGVISGGYFVRDDGNRPESDYEIVEMVTLESLDSEIGGATHLKIDVEGAELSVLRGGRELLLGENAPMIFLELHRAMIEERGEEPVVVLDYLRDCGYELYTSVGEPASVASLIVPPIVRLIAKKG